jgi:hypothetical protein
MHIRAQCSNNMHKCEESTITKRRVMTQEMCSYLFRIVQRRGRGVSEL